MADVSNAGGSPRSGRPVKRRAKAHPAASKTTALSRLVRKPLVWLAVVVVAAFGMYFQDVISGGLGGLFSGDDAADAVSGDPIKVIDIYHDLDVENDVLLRTSDTPRIRRALSVALRSRVTGCYVTGSTSGSPDGRPPRRIPAEMPDTGSAGRVNAITRPATSPAPAARTVTPAPRRAGLTGSVAWAIARMDW